MTDSSTSSWSGYGHPTSSSSTSSSKMLATAPECSGRKAQHHSPSALTLEFIRQFARTYRVLQGMPRGLDSLLLN